MPRLTVLQWLVLVALLGFYGFAVFAFTRDYYLRHPPGMTALPGPQAQVPHALPPAGATTWIQREMQQRDAPPLTDLSGADPELVNQQGDELFAQKRYAEAITYYRRVLELAPGDPDAQNDLGLALHYTGDSSSAVEVLKKGTAAAPDFQRLWLTLGFVSGSAGDSQGARVALEKARSLDPDNGVGQEALRILNMMR